MIRPQDTTTRECKNLNGWWRFALDPDSGGTAAAWFVGPLPEADRQILFKIIFILQRYLVGRLLAGSVK
jgi:hypothetical protein